jgi:transposase-like protein
MAFAIMCSSKKGVSALQLQRQLGLGSYRSAWHLAHRVRHAMAREPLAGLLKGTVEADETYVGGKPRKFAGPRKGPKYARNPRGRGTKKTPIIALIERDGRVRAKPAERADAKTLAEFARANVDPSAKFYTDEWAGYTTVGREFSEHAVVNHGKREYARGPVNTNTAEAFFALLKRGVVGSFHSISKKHTAKYVDEFSFRWDRRKMSDGERTVEAIQSGVGKRLAYREPISKGH